MADEEGRSLESGARHDRIAGVDTIGLPPFHALVEERS
jgi:hypothetical protein